MAVCDSFVTLDYISVFWMVAGEELFRLMLSDHHTVCQVFVQCRRVSCHCGHQSTVVYGRVWYFSFGDIQIQLFFVLLCFSDMMAVIHWTFKNLQEKLWSSVGMLSVPLKTVNVISTVVAGKSRLFSFYSMMYSRHGCYCIRKNTLWKMISRTKE